MEDPMGIGIKGLREGLHLMRVPYMIYVNDERTLVRNVMSSRPSGHRLEDYRTE